MLARLALEGDPRSVRSLAAIVLALSCGGCLLAPVGDSCEVATKDMSMEAFVVDNGSNVRAVADFVYGAHGELGSQRLDLCAEDVLTINGVEVNEVEKSDRIEYSVSWDPAEAPSTYTFSLSRESNMDMEASVDLPPPFSVVGPPADADVPRSQDLTVDWAPEDPAGTVEFVLDDELGEPCAINPDSPDYKGGVEVPDVGTLIVQAGAIIYDGPPTPTGACAMHLQLTRQAEGSYPEELEPSGRIEARVERRVDFVSVP